MSTLDPTTASKLARVCGLLASDHDGERAAAAWQASRILRTAGLTWQDVFTPTRAPPSQPSHALLVAWALKRPSQLSPWETTFLTDIGSRTHLTLKQRTVLARIIDRLREGGK